ncbi:restriction endonuclease subunit S [Rheinheimera sp. YQF-2]|uniref:Restriction endonuclease subunit S n=2 Tax=Rheinheimera lutimaris TaxID=2740584 RepID=A0A7Y5AS95_9GAMM|nr:restriction endonuclease subunit S [Rheinheimera lutimaris]
MSDDSTFKFNINKLETPLAVSKEYPVFTTKDLDSDFLLLKLNNGNDFKKYAAIQKMGGTRTRLYYKNLSAWNTLLPEQDEQVKVKDFLLSIESAILNCRKKIELEENFVAGLASRIFSGEVRFKKPDGTNYLDWQDCELGSYLLERSEKGHADLELLSVTLSDGVISRSDVEGKNNASEDRSNYKRVLPGDIAYNSMRMWQGASGLSSMEGIVSPAYTVLTTKSNADPLFFSYFFKHPSVIFIFKRYSQGLTSDTWNLKFPTLSKIKFKLPVEKSEQEKISSMLLSFETRIKLLNEKRDKLIYFKGVLINELFV